MKVAVDPVELARMLGMATDSGEVVFQRLPTGQWELAVGRRTAKDGATFTAFQWLSPNLPEWDVDDMTVALFRASVWIQANGAMWL